MSTIASINQRALSIIALVNHRDLKQVHMVSFLEVISLIPILLVFTAATPVMVETPRQCPFCTVILSKNTQTTSIQPLFTYKWHQFVLQCLHIYFSGQL